MEPKKDPTTEFVRGYASELQTIYDERTAGDYTFIGVLAEFLMQLDHLER